MPESLTVKAYILDLRARKHEYRQDLQEFQVETDTVDPDTLGQELHDLMGLSGRYFVRVIGIQRNE